ncbi:MAG: EamA family transporter [Actinomycetes bacterium]
MPAGQSGARVWLALGIVYVVWGSTYLAIRVVVLAGLPPMLSMSARFAAAAVLLAAVLAVRTGPRRLLLPPRQVGASAVVGLFLLLGGNGLVAVAEEEVPSALAALLVATTPLWLVLMRSVTGDLPRAPTWVGTAVGFAGVAVLARPGGHEGDVTWAGTLLVVLATLLWATGSMSAGRLPMPADPFASSVWQMAAGALGLLAGGTLRGEWADVDLAAVEASGWVALGYLVVFGSLVAYTAYAWLLGAAPISLVSTYAYVNPVVAVVLGWALLAEPVTAAVVLGGGLAVLGVLLVVRTERGGRRRQAVQAAAAPAPAVKP